MDASASLEKTAYEVSENWAARAHVRIMANLYLALAVSSVAVLVFLSAVLVLP